MEVKKATEAVSSGRETLAYIVGIGVNVGKNEFPEEIREIATSLALNADEKNDLVFSILAHISAVLGEKKETLLDYLREKSVVLGRPIRFSGAKEGEGIALDLAESGGLIVLTGQREKVTLTGGEISVRTK